MRLRAPSVDDLEALRLEVRVEGVGAREGAGKPEGSLLPRHAVGPFVRDRTIHGLADHRRSYRPTAAAEASIEGYDGWGARTGDAPMAADRSFFLSESGNSFASPSSKYVIAETVVA